MREGRTLALVACLLLAATPASARRQLPVAQASPATLAELLGAFGRMPGLEVRFEETKHLRMLAAPLVQRGVIFFRPPGTLLKRVEGARAEDVLVTPTRVVRRQRGREDVIDLGSRPDVRPLVESMLWIFSGNRADLERAYRVTYTRSTDTFGYELALVPKGAPLNQLVASMSIRGLGFGVSEIEVRETSGNRTVTRIVSANPERRFTPTEAQQLFGEAPAR